MEMQLKVVFAITLYEPDIIGVPEALSTSLANMTGAVEDTIAKLASRLS
jgi:hypothetical protein